MRRFGSDELNRRGFLGGLGFLAASIFGGQRLWGGRGAPSNRQDAWMGKITGLGETGNVYEELGLTTVINGEQRRFLAVR
jgi:hypothetical protein